MWARLEKSFSISVQQDHLSTERYTFSLSFTLKKGSCSRWYKIHQHLQRNALHQSVWLTHFSLLDKERQHTKGSEVKYYGESLHRL